MGAKKSVPSPMTPPGGLVRPGGARVYDDTNHDPYRLKQKYREPTVCKDCRAIFHRGRWQWGDAPEGAHEAVCPACRRVREKLPAGTLTLTGNYLDRHRTEILAIIRHQDELEKSEHPLNRVIDVHENANGIVVTTTDVHLPKRIGAALTKAHQGDIRIRFAEDESAIDVEWWRN